MVNGSFGPATTRAVKRFQQKYGISQTGTVGPVTRAKINELFGR
ncbi:MAG: peptidoglycan-binding domain-containing protein [Candidatus Paceibacterota bacterium]